MLRQLRRRFRIAHSASWIAAALALGACAAPGAWPSTSPGTSPGARSGSGQGSRPGAASLALPSRVTWGAHAEAYPAGLVSGVHVEWPLGARDTLRARAAWNWTRRGDFGEHDDERGGGPGAGLGWRRYQGPGRDGWLWGLRVDVWALDVDWSDDLPGGGEREGSTDVTVVQPAAEGGYRWRLSNSGLALDLTAALGAEINVDTRGEDVGQGAILLLGVALSF